MIFLLKYLKLREGENGDSYLEHLVSNLDQITLHWLGNLLVSSFHILRQLDPVIFAIIHKIIFLLVPLLN